MAETTTNPEGLAGLIERESFDHKGVHFIGLNNAAQLEGLGSIGDEQMAWLKSDVARLAASTPIVVFANIPLWAAYPESGWATKDSAQALDLLKRFGLVTVLNGHIHQVGVYGRNAGKDPQFTYPDAVKNTSVAWDELTVDRWLTDTEASYPTTTWLFG